MEQMDAVKAAEAIVERVQDYSITHLDTRDEVLRGALYDMAFAMLSLLGERKIVYLTHDLSENQVDGSWAGRVIAFTDREIIESKISAARDGRGGAPVTIRPRSLIESLAVSSISRPKHGVDWPSAIEVQVTLQGETLSLPLKSAGGSLPSEAYQNLLGLLPGLIEDSLAPVCCSREAAALS